MDGRARQLRAGDDAASSPARRRAGWPSSAASSPRPWAKGPASFPTTGSRTGPAASPLLAGRRPRRRRPGPPRDARARSRLEELSASIGTGTAGEIRSALARLVGGGLGARLSRRRSPAPPAARAGERFCARHLLARIHSAMRAGSRRSVEAVSPQQFMRFLLSWQHVGAGHRLLGSGGVLEVIEQLQGYEAARRHLGVVDPARPGSPATTPPCSTSGAPGARSPSAGSRLRAADRPGARRGAAAPRPRRRPRSACSGATTSTGCSPRHVTGPTPEPAQRRGGRSRWSRRSRRHGALFVTDLCQMTGRMPGEVAEALWDGMARGLLTADGFQAVRALLGGRGRFGRVELVARPGRPRCSPRRAGRGPGSRGRA